nr:hypothetical protein [Tanacetum cinerariifolium]
MFGDQRQPILVRLLQIVLKTMNIYFEIRPVGLGQLDGAIWINMRDSKRTRPAGFEFSGENLQSGVKEEDSITDVENTVLDFRVMKPLSFLLVDERSFISLIMKFIDLNFSVITCSLQIKVCMFEGSVGFVLELNRKMTSFFVNQLI